MTNPFPMTGHTESSIGLLHLLDNGRQAPQLRLFAALLCAAMPAICGCAPEVLHLSSTGDSDYICMRDSNLVLDTVVGNLQVLEYKEDGNFRTPMKYWKYRIRLDVKKVVKGAWDGPSVDLKDSDTAVWVNSATQQIGGHFWNLENKFVPIGPYAFSLGDDDGMPGHPHKAPPPRIYRLYCSGTAPYSSSRIVIDWRSATDAEIKAYGLPEPLK
jgi:hypothetical protein